MSDTRQHLTRTSRRNRAQVLLVLAAIAVLAAGILPTCRVKCCSSMMTMASVHHNMPCCAPDRSIAPRDFDRPTHTEAFAGAPSVPLVAIAVPLVAPSASSLSADASHEVDTSQQRLPLFLQNAQLLI